jgi:hypothetical protein
MSFDGHKLRKLGIRSLGCLGIHKIFFESVWTPDDTLVANLSFLCRSTSTCVTNGYTNDKEPQQAGHNSSTACEIGALVNGRVTEKDTFLTGTWCGWHAWRGFFLVGIDESTI